MTSNPNPTPSLLNGSTERQQPPLSFVTIATSPLLVFYVIDKAFGLKPKESTRTTTIYCLPLSVVHGFQELGYLTVM